MDVEIDEAGEDQSASGVDLHGPSGSFEVRPYRNDSALIDQHIGHAVESTRVDHVPVRNKNFPV
jgi:hypothetical protein